MVYYPAHTTHRERDCVAYTRLVLLWPGGGPSIASMPHPSNQGCPTGRIPVAVHGLQGLKLQARMFRKYYR